MRFSEFNEDINTGMTNAVDMGGLVNQLLGVKPTADTSDTNDDTPQSISSAPVDVKSIQDPDFNKKLTKIASALGVNANDILAIMKLESGIRPDAVNPISNATGLIQFMPATARRLGTTVEDLRRMSAVDQLDYVYKYFKNAGVKPGMSRRDLYAAVFYPKAMGQPGDHVISTKGNKVYDQNKVLDANHDNKITVADLGNKVDRIA